MKRLLITGGGTGGHLVIAKALKEESLKQEIKTFYIGSTYGQDTAWFENDTNFSSTLFFNTSGVVNKRGLKKLFSLISIMKSTFTAASFIRKNKIDAVISVGGYSAAPASFAALLQRVPFYIHEQNATMGKLNKLLKPYAKCFFSSYHFPFYDYPVRNVFFKTKRIRSNVKTVLFLGGSQGAVAINTLALELAPWLQEQGFNIIHQCGEKNLATVQEAYKKLSINATLFGFTNTMAYILSQADFAIARAGASTVWETTANVLPTLFIPYPYAAGDHQTANAQTHVNNHAGWIMQENTIDIEQIKTILLQDHTDISTTLQTMLQPHACGKIIKTIKDTSC